MLLCGLEIPDRLVLKLAHMVDDDELEVRLRASHALDIRILGLDVEERETVLLTLQDPPDGLEDLRATLLQERAWLRSEGLT